MTGAVARHVNVTRNHVLGSMVGTIVGEPRELCPAETPSAQRETVGTPRGRFPFGQRWQATRLERRILRTQFLWFWPLVHPLSPWRAEIMAPRYAADGLGESGKALWRRIVPLYELRPDELETLEDVCRMTDVIDALDAAWAEDNRPMTAKGSQGQLVIHPIIGELRTQPLARNVLWRQLKLPGPRRDLRPDQLVLLESAARTFDTIAELQAALVGQPLIVPGSLGEVREHPLLSETRLQRASLARLLAQLKLPDLDGGEEPNQHRAAAFSRWAAAHGGRNAK
jgi:hypothetical protein